VTVTKISLTRRGTTRRSFRQAAAVGFGRALTVLVLLCSLELRLYGTRSKILQDGERHGFKGISPRKDLFISSLFSQLLMTGWQLRDRWHSSLRRMSDTCSLMGRSFRQNVVRRSSPVSFVRMIFLNCPTFPTSFLTKPLGTLTIGTLNEMRYNLDVHPSRRSGVCKTEGHLAAAG
jgi:hypothetical protein